MEVRFDTENGLELFPDSLYTLCDKRGVIGFDELLRRAKVYFISIGANVDHLLVDEFQDIGSLEYEFLRALDAQNCLFVGDDFQAIYSFKGGNVKIFLSLIEDPAFTAFYLTNNYRNGTEILKIADIVISQVSDKINKDVTPISTEAGKVSIETKGSLTKILRSNIAPTSETQFRDWFILCRTNKEVFTVTAECERMGIPTICFKREGMSYAEVSNILRQNKVKVLTVHVSKGLESKNVILYGNFPITVPSYRKNEDERKVMYVGITRAKENLIILN